jgi:hypothetical protein
MGIGWIPVLGCPTLKSPDRLLPCLKFWAGDRNQTTGFSWKQVFFEQAVGTKGLDLTGL